LLLFERKHSNLHNLSTRRLAGSPALEINFYDFDYRFLHFGNEKENRRVSNPVVIAYCF
jgi:hypothetical protein